MTCVVLLISVCSISKVLLKICFIVFLSMNLCHVLCTVFIGFWHYLISLNAFFPILCDCSSFFIPASLYSMMDVALLIMSSPLSPHPLGDRISTLFALLPVVLLHFLFPLCVFYVSFLRLSFTVSSHLQ